MTFFFLVFTKFWAKNWTFSDVMTLKEPVLLVNSENMVTLPKIPLWETRYTQSFFVFGSALYAFSCNSAFLDETSIQFE